MSTTIKASFSGGSQPAVQTCTENPSGSGTYAGINSGDFFVVAFQLVNGIYKGNVINPPDFGSYGQALEVTKNDSSANNVIGTYEDATGVFTCVVTP